MDELEMLKELDKLINDTPDLNTVLEETGAPIESLTAQADELQAEYDALSEKLALNVSDPLPLRWEKLLRLHSAGNQDALRLLNMYISDCSFSAARKNGSLSTPPPGKGLMSLQHGRSGTPCSRGYSADCLSG